MQSSESLSNAGAMGLGSTGLGQDAAEDIWMLDILPVTHKVHISEPSFAIHEDPAGCAWARRLSDAKNRTVLVSFMMGLRRHDRRVSRPYGAC